MRNKKGKENERITSSISRLLGALAIALMVTILCTPASSAGKLENISFVPNVKAGYVDYELEFGDQIKLNDQYYALGAGLTIVIKERYYIGVSGEWSVSDIEDTYTSPGPMSFSSDWIGDREDYTVTLGHMLTERFTVFGGYKYGKTELDVENVTLNGAEIDFIRDSEFKSDGFFLGATYGFPIKDIGLLRFNLAVAKLVGKLTDKGIYEGTPNFDDVFYGDTIGFSYGISWNSSVTEKISYGVSLDGHRYDYEFGNAYEKEMGEDAKETMLGIRVSLSYQF